MKKKSGFTVIEILVVIALAIFATVLFFSQKNSIQQQMRDQERKASINSLYFQLKDVFYKQNNYYPETLTPELLTGIDPEVFTDPNGILLGEAKSNYSYKATNCENNHCQKFELKAKLEKEGDFIRSSR